MKKHKTLSIVVPVYFNEGSLPRLFEELKTVEQELGERDIHLELIFVDDGSGDGSLDELVKIKHKRKDTKIVKLTRKAVNLSRATASLFYRRTCRIPRP
jgi:glycosyltransferase involved in cell wall biosynthesis